LSRDRVESISGPDREIKDIMSANNVSIETAKDLHENARKCRKAKIRRG
jgi:predicted transcriptional regulator